jgi:putative transposase
VKYAFIEQQTMHWPVTKLGRVLRVTRSAYYDWCMDKRMPAGTTELAVRQRMRALFKASRQSIGSRRMAEGLRAEGFDVGRDWATRRMKALGLIV